MDIFQKQLDDLKQRRVSQADILPQAVKTRHLGEGAPYILSGLSADRPTSGSLVTQGASFWWSTDTHVLSIWDGIIWRTVTLT